MLLAMLSSEMAMVTATTAASIQLVVRLPPLPSRAFLRPKPRSRLCRIRSDVAGDAEQRNGHGHGHHGGQYPAGGALATIAVACVLAAEAAQQAMQDQVALAQAAHSGEQPDGVQ